MRQGRVAAVWLPALPRQLTPWGEKAAGAWKSLGSFPGCIELGTGHLPALLPWEDEKFIGVFVCPVSWLRSAGLRPTLVPLGEVSFQP